MGGGAQDEGDTEAGSSTSFLLERLPGPMPTPSSPSRPQHIPRDQGWLSQPILGILRAFQDCTGRFGGFSLTLPMVL